MDLAAPTHRTFCREVGMIRCEIIQISTFHLFYEYLYFQTQENEIALWNCPLNEGQNEPVLISRVHTTFDVNDINVRLSFFKLLLV